MPNGMRLERLPGVHLELRADEIERQVEVRPLSGEVVGELVDRAASDRVVDDIDRLGVDRRDPVEVVLPQDGAHASVGHDDPQVADRRRHRGDAQVVRTDGDGGSGHGELRCEGKRGTGQGAGVTDAARS